jgi:hypothetical protein
MLPLAWESSLQKQNVTILPKEDWNYADSPRVSLAMHFMHVFNIFIISSGTRPAQHMRPIRDIAGHRVGWEADA